MKFKVRPKIALCIETSRSYGRDLLRGVALFARTHTHWSLLHQEMSLDAALHPWVQEADVSGVIARVDVHNVAALRGLRVPIVDVCCRRDFSGIPRVETDNRAVSKLAFDHLWGQGFRRFAFCGYQFAHYSVERLQFFRELAAAADCPISTYETLSRPTDSLSSIEESGLVDVESMSSWLRSLTAPTGLFVCNDIRGQQVLNACQTMEVAIPDDLGVIGVDDDDAICPLTDPPLSSVRPNAEQAGYRAAEVLNQMLNGQAPDRSIEYVPPRHVVQRLSTQVNAVEDRELARVCRFIREHACEGINVNYVTRFTSLSRRQLERRFHSELARTPHEQITLVQIARVKQLLQETPMTLEQIAPLAGYCHKESLSAVFKRETGETPGQYRERCASQ